MITYNGANHFTNNGQQEPLVSLSNSFISFGDRWAQSMEFTLDGVITGCSPQEIIDARTALIAGFSTQYKQLVIEQLGTFDGCVVDPIDFQDSEYFSNVPYSIKIISYPQGYFEENVGVLDPKYEVSFSEQEDRTVVVRREISARGVNHSGGGYNTSVNNAIAFVQAKQALPIITPFSIELSSVGADGYLTDVSETIDRINGTASVSETYVLDAEAAVNPDVVLRYSREISILEGEYNQVSYNGTISAGRLGSATELKAKYNALRNSIPTNHFITESVNLDPNINQIQFTLTYLTNGTDIDAQGIIPRVDDDFTITIQESAESSVFDVSIQGNLSSKVASLANKFSVVSGYFFSNVNDDMHYNYCKDIYGRFYSTAYGSFQNAPSNVILEPTALSQGYSYDIRRGTFSYNAQFNDRNNLGLDVKAFDYSVTNNCSLRQYDLRPIYSGGFCIVDMGTNSPANFGFSANARCNSVSIEEMNDIFESAFVALTEDMHAAEPNNFQVQKAITTGYDSVSFSSSMFYVAETGLTV